MGILKFSALKKQFLKNNTKAVIKGDSFGNNLNVLAFDANSLLYVAYEEILNNSTVCTKLPNNTYQTHHTKDNFSSHLVTQIVNLLRAYVQLLPANYVVIAYDSQVNIAKINQQANRRKTSYDAMGNLKGDNNVYSSSNEIVFSPNWFVPFSPIMQKVEKAIKDDNSISGSQGRIISGPGVPGEGEHKIIQILHSMMNKENEECAGPKKIAVIGNDNDLYFLLALFESNYEDLSTYMFDAHGSAREWGNGRLRPEKNTELNFIPINNIIAGMLSQEDAPFEHVVRKPKYDVILQITILCFLFGNDFIPAISFDYDDQNDEPVMHFDSDVNMVNFYKLLMRASKTVNSPIAKYSNSYEVGEDDEINTIPVNFNLAVLAQIFKYVAAELRTPRPGKPIIKEAALEQYISEDFHNKMANYMHRVNYYDVEKSNIVSSVAALEYVCMMETVATYYVSTTRITHRAFGSVSNKSCVNSLYAFNGTLPSFYDLFLGAETLSIVRNGNYKLEDRVVDLYNRVLTDPYVAELESEKITSTGLKKILDKKNLPHDSTSISKVRSILTKKVKKLLENSTIYLANEIAVQYGVEDYHSFEALKKDASNEDVIMRAIENFSLGNPNIYGEAVEVNFPTPALQAALVSDSTTYDVTDVTSAIYVTNSKYPHLCPVSCKHAPFISFRLIESLEQELIDYEHEETSFDMPQLSDINIIENRKGKKKKDAKIPFVDNCLEMKKRASPSV
jgi:hypothetical protein